MKSSGRVLGVMLLSGILAVAGGVRRAWGEDKNSVPLAGNDQRIAALEEKLRLVEERLRQLERLLAADSPALLASAGAVPAVAVRSQAEGAGYSAAPAAALPSPAPASAAPPAVAGPARQAPAQSYVSADPFGFYLFSPERDFSLRIRYQLNVDGRFAVKRNEQIKPNTFFIRRSQPIFEGTLYKRFGYHFLPEFSQGSVRLVNAWIDANITPWFRIRAGRTKGPVGLERLRAGTELALAERGLPTQLAPNRDLGLQFFGDLARERVSYMVGVFNGVPDGESSDGNNDDHMEFNGRVMTQPFAGSSHRNLSKLSFGIAGSYGEVEGNTESSGLGTYESSSGSPLFAYREGQVVARGIHYRLSPQGHYYAGPFGVMAEYIQSVQEVRRAERRGTMNHSAWQLMGSYVLTGDQGSFQGVTPDHPFNPETGDWGAVEVGARFAMLTTDRQAFPDFADPQESARQAKAWSLALTWYLNRNVKLVLGYERTKFESAAPGVTFDSERLFQQRLQLRF